MSSIGMYKAIIPLDYMYPNIVNLITSPNITSKVQNYRITWNADAGDVQMTHVYQGNDFILMDRFHITTRSGINFESPTSGSYEGIINYTMNLTDSTDQVVSRYCRVYFSFRITGNGSLYPLTVNIKVTTPFGVQKPITFNYNRYIKPTVYITPYVDVDWADPTELVVQA